jgi:hypothetical protein
VEIPKAATKSCKQDQYGHENETALHSLPADGMRRVGGIRHARNHRKLKQFVAPNLKLAAARRATNSSRGNRERLKTAAWKSRGSNHASPWLGCDFAAIMPPQPYGLGSSHDLRNAHKLTAS